MRGNNIPINGTPPSCTYVGITMRGNNIPINGTPRLAYMWE